MCALVTGVQTCALPISLVKPAQEGESGRDLQLFQQNRGEDYVREFAQHALENNELVSERDQKEHDAGLVELYRKAKSDLQEGGANTLFLALGVLTWKARKSVVWGKRGRVRVGLGGGRIIKKKN